MKGPGKGNTNNPNGRPKGVQNKVTSDLKLKIRELLNGEWEAFENNLRVLDPVDHVNAITKLCGFVLPRLSSVSVSEEVDAEYKALEKLLKSAPEEAVEQLAERILILKQKQDGE